MIETGERIREEIARARRSGVGPRQRFRLELVAGAARFARMRLANGASRAQVCRELGIRAVTLSRWRLREPPSGVGFRRVALTATRIGPVEAVRQCPIVIRTPRGLVVESVDAEQAARLVAWLERSLS